LLTKRIAEYLKSFYRVKNMKSEERHKLHQNALAAWINQAIAAVKPYQNALLGAVILVILAIIIGTWWFSESASRAAAAWSQFFEAYQEGNSAALEKVAEDNPGSRAAMPADLVAADIQLAQGCYMLFINKATANQQLSKAADLYQQVRDRTSLPALRVQAVFGLARTREAQGQLPAAVQLYTEVAKNWPDSVYAKLSEKRLADLKRDSIKEMYDKFAKYDPKPMFTPPSGEKTGLDQIPAESPLFTPGPVEEKPPAKPEETPQAAGEEKPLAAPEQKPEATSQQMPENRPEGAQPADKSEKPAEGQK
jgi:tetratricopeptide (TPR) repeat protein